MNFDDLLKHVEKFSPFKTKKEPTKKHAENKTIELKETHPLPNNPDFWQNKQGVIIPAKKQPIFPSSKDNEEIFANFEKTFNNAEKFTIKQAELSLNPWDLAKIISLVEKDNFSKKAFLTLFNSPKFSNEEKNNWENLSKSIDYLFYSSNETKKYYSDILSCVFDNKKPKDDRILKKITGKGGLIDLNKLNFALKSADKATPFVIEKLFDIYSLAREEDVEFVYNKLESVFESPVGVAKNLARSFEFCFEYDEGNLVEKSENIEYLRKIAKNVKNLSANANFYEFIKNPQNKQLLLELSKYEISNSDLAPLYEIVQTNTKNGEFDEFCKEKLFEFARTNASLKNFAKIYNACLKNNKDDFDEDLFNKTIKINAFFPDFVENTQENELFKDLIKGNVEIKDLNFKTRIKIYNSLVKIKEILQQNETQEKPQKNEIIEIICRIFKETELSLLDSDTFLDVDDISRKNFIVNILKSLPDSNTQNVLTNFETTIKNSIPLLKEMNKGLDLEYSRKDFLKDLTKLCDDDEKIKILSKKAQIAPILDKDKNITGYNGIINLKNLDRKDEFENQIYNLANKFIYENKITTKDENLNQALNIIIKALPEFVNIIGKKQNPVHSHTLDVHALLVLANSINNPDYKKLTTIDKTMLKLTCLIHDISKAENISDDGHYNQSAIISKGISKRFFTNPFAQDRIYDLVKNHHWLEKLNTSNKDKEENIRKIAYRFRQPNDYDIAKIFAKADLQSVSDKFFEQYKTALESEDINLIDKELDWFYSTGCAVFSDSIIAKSKLENHKEILDGVEYKVINFNKIDDDEDMGEYGFTSGKKKKDLYLLVHMLSEKGATAGNFEALKSLSSSINKGVLSQSLITPEYKKTFADSCGVLLSNINTNIITMTDCNQTSGVEKGFSNISDLLHSKKNYRTFFKEQFLKCANIDENSITELEFANFYRKNIAQKTSFAQFHDNKEYILNEKIKFKGSELKEILKQVQDSIIDKKELDWNEIVGYVPKINAVVAKAQNLKEVPKTALNFANENDLAVILI